MSDDQGKEIEEVFQALDKEAGQEARVVEGQTSLFADAPVAEAIRERVREFDDVEKHIVRWEHWLPIARRLRAAKGSGLRILTLPGQHRLEIEMYRAADLVDEVDLGDGIPALDCIGFETSPDVFGMLETMSPPIAGLRNESLVDALANTGTDSHKWLVDQFPFDIINLDLTVNLVKRSEGPYGPVLQAIRECLRLQTQHQGEWCLMLTFRAGVEDTDPNLIDRLKQQFDENINQHPKLKQVCHERFSVSSADELLNRDSEEALGHFAAKWIADQAHQFHWKVSDVQQMCYKRTPSGHRYSIRKLIFLFEQESLPSYELPQRQLPLAGWHMDDLERVIGQTIVVDIDRKRAAYSKKKPKHLEWLAQQIEELKERTMSQPGGTTEAGTT